MFTNNQVLKIILNILPDTFFINMVLVHLLSSVQPQSFLEWTRTSFEQSMEFYTNLLQEHLQIALEMLEVAICSSL
jgi:uncharacterized protein YggT (Ycf19 family)